MTEPMDAGALRRLADELEVRNIIARLAQLADNDGDELRDYLALMTEDAVWESRAGTQIIAGSPPRVGHASIREGALERRRDGVQGPEAGTLHTVNTTVVEVHGDRATAKSYFMYLRDIHDTARLAHAGAYNDEFRRTPQGWKLARRVLSPR